MDLLWWILFYYSVYLRATIAYAVISALLDIRLGVRGHYIRFLLALFELAAKFAWVYEEESLDETEANRTPNSSGEKTPTKLKREGLIHREAVDQLRKKLKAGDQKRETGYLSIIVPDVLDYITAGFEAIVEDEVSSSFSVAELPCWNLMTRTKAATYSQVMNWRLRLMWGLGVLFRYVFLVPVKSVVLFIGLGYLGIAMAFVSVLPKGPWRRKLGIAMSLGSFRIIGKSMSLQGIFHNVDVRDKMRGGICVANHTSPIDTIILCTRHMYALTGQKQGGMIGYVEKALSRAGDHIWFDRSERADREKVTQIMRDHANDPSKAPIILFPEGVCVNNTSVMQFKKGAFEASDTVYPIAMKYDSLFGDAFWWQDTWFGHVWGMITSWAILCHVWYLEPMTRKPEETASEFADRVKAAISEAAGLRHLQWDGFLKQYTVKRETIEEEKVKYSMRLMQTLPFFGDTVQEE